MQRGSGDPLLVERSGRWQLVGLSVDDGSCASRPTGLYTHVARHLHWIEKVMHRLEQQQSLQQQQQQQQQQPDVTTSPPRPPVVTISATGGTVIQLPNGVTLSTDTGADTTTLAPVEPTTISPVTGTGSFDSGWFLLNASSRSLSHSFSTRPELFVRLKRISFFFANLHYDIFDRKRSYCVSWCAPTFRLIDCTCFRAELLIGLAPTPETLAKFDHQAISSQP